MFVRFTYSGEGEQKDTFVYFDIEHFPVVSVERDTSKKGSKWSCLEVQNTATGNTETTNVKESPEQVLGVLAVAKYISKAMDKQGFSSVEDSQSLLYVMWCKKGKKPVGACLYGSAIAQTDKKEVKRLKEKEEAKRRKKDERDLKKQVAKDKKLYEENMEKKAQLKANRFYRRVWRFLFFKN